MAADQRIDLYCLCWNDARMLPHFFRHYDPIVDRYFVFDNGSTDGSLDYLAAHPRTTVRHFDTTDDSFVETQRRMSDTIWHKSRGEADWVILVDIDEFIQHPDLRGYLQRCRSMGVTVLRGIGYDMVSDGFPLGSDRLVDVVTEGVRSAAHDKLCLFDPDAILETRYQPGRHEAMPQGRVVWPERSEILLLHYRQLGTDYAVARSAELRPGFKDKDLENGWGRQYLWSATEISNRWAALVSDSGPVPGLGEYRDMDPAQYDEEYVIAASGLFDAEFYESTYPDVKLAGGRPLTHFCLHGWKEDRQPNPAFQPKWYVGHNPAAALARRNPLAHYILEGEAAGARPSPGFDPAEYAALHGLAPGESPLRHFLEHLEVVQAPAVAPTPVPAAAPIPAAEDVAPPPSIPIQSENQLKETQMSVEFPSYDEVVALLGVDPLTTNVPTAIESTVLINLINNFIPLIPVDEAWYLERYPDVGEAVKGGTLPSGKAHFVEFGYFEGRDPAPPTE